MKVRLALAVAVAALGLGVAAAEPAVSITPTTATHTCSSRYTHAVLSSGPQSAWRPASCASASADREYHRYRFHCHKRDSAGRYHLTR